MTDEVQLPTVIEADRMLASSLWHRDGPLAGTTIDWVLVERIAEKIAYARAEGMPEETAYKDEP